MCSLAAGLFIFYSINVKDSDPASAAGAVGDGFNINVVNDCGEDAAEEEDDEDQEFVDAL